MRIIKLVAGIVLSVLMLMVVSVTGILFFLVSLGIWVVTVPFDRRRVVLHRFSCYCLAFWAFIMPTWRIRVEGREKLPKDQPCVIVANHQSQLDIIMTALLFHHFKWVSKAEVFRVPFIGWQMALNRYIKIRRGYVNSISRMMDDCRQALCEGSSILLFPEGTRSEDGSVKSFKPGAFILAKEQSLPIVPVVIYGTREALPVNRMMSFGIHRIRVKVLDAIPPAGYLDLEPETMASRVKDTIEKQLEILEKRVELGLS